MTAMQRFYLSFSLTAVTNSTLELGIWNFLWR